VKEQEKQAGIEQELRSVWNLWVLAYILALFMLFVYKMKITPSFQELKC
jgi:hypothetical protein